MNQHFQDVHRRTSNISNSSNSNSNSSNNNTINLKTEHTEECAMINNTIRNNGNNKNPNNHPPNNQKNNKIIDPNSIDVVQIEQILTNELNNCSMTDRNNIQEEIHGVNCCSSSVSSSLLLSPTTTTTTINIGSETNENQNETNETTIPPPELFEGERSLQLLTNELNNDEHIPRSKKYAYLLSQELQNKEEDIFSLLYVNTNEFRFMYLRCEFFDIKKTALRIVQVLDFLLEYYGKYALYRQIQLTDFTEYELTILKNKGYCQLLPSRDRGGRRIMVQFLLNDFDNVPIPVLQKIFIYLCFVCASSDVEDQRKGIVLLCWAEHLTNQHRIKPRNGQKNIALLFAPIRFVSIHLCAKNTIFTNIIKAVIIARLNSDSRRRLICNLGESVEVRYSLQGYGIPVDSVPVTWSGAIKTVNVKRFINFQTYIEEKDASAIVTNNTITDCPYLNDILFKKGHTAEHQPGNMQFRSIINSVYTQHYLQQQQHQQQKQQQEQLLLVGSSPSPPSASASASASAVVSVSIKVLVPDIIQKIKQDKRFRVLVWDNNQHWWNILSDPLDYKKYVYASTHFFLKNYVIASSSSSSLTTPKAKAKSKARSKSKPRVKVTASASVQAAVLPTSAAAAAAAAAAGSNQKRIRQQQVIESSTSIFNKSPDGKKRMTSFDFIRNHITNNGGGNSDRDSHSDECFGLPFQSHNI